MNRTRTTTLILAILVAISAFLISASVFAKSPDGREGHTASVHEALGQWFKRKLRVRCDRGESLSRALHLAREHQTVRFSGTCFESIVIKTDHLTLQGENGATIDGGRSSGEAVVTIDGARGVTLANFTTQNGPDQGILATHQSQGLLKDLVVQNNGTIGLSVDRSHLEIVDLVLDNNRTGGMDAYTGSTIVARGKLSASDNGGDGLAANGKTFLELRGATVIASQNGGTGVSIINDSRLQIFSFPEAQGSSINADNNGFAGIGLMGSELGVVGSQFFGSGANVISAMNNGVFGFFAPAGAILSPHATARFVAYGNGVGMLLEDGGSALIVGGIDFAKNGAGLSAHGAGTLTLVSVPPNPSRIVENRIDLDLGFGTRLTNDSVEFATIACDKTVLVRGAECR